MKILVIATRHPGGRQTGRKTVLHTIIKSCQSLGHEVRVIAITNEEVVDTDNFPNVETFRPPLPLRVAVNIFTKAFFKRLCLNECLYISPSIQNHVNGVCEDWKPDLVIADMIRTAEIALRTGFPTHVDLDDLLSTRYLYLSSEGADASSILGYYGNFLPRSIRSLGAQLAARFIKAEAKLMAQREDVIARKAHTVSLVSEKEALLLQARVGRRVDWLPMSVRIVETPADVASNSADVLVFVGGLDFHANVQSVRTYLKEVYPALGADPPTLYVIGYCPEDVRNEFKESPGIVLMGYVDDIEIELKKARAFVAPISPGTGIKTKVLEAMAMGLPVITTSHGVQGTPAVQNTNCIIADTGEEIALAISRLRDDPQLAARIGMAGREMISTNFAPEVIAERWKIVLSEHSNY